MLGMIGRLPAWCAHHLGKSGFQGPGLRGAREVGKVGKGRGREGGACHAAHFTGDCVCCCLGPVGSNRDGMRRHEASMRLAWRVTVTMPRPPPRPWLLIFFSWLYIFWHGGSLQNRGGQEEGQEEGGRRTKKQRAYVHLSPCHDRV